MHIDRIVHWGRLGSAILAVLGSGAVLIGLSMPARAGLWVVAIGIVTITVSLALWLALLLIRMWRRIVGCPQRSDSERAMPAYACPNCGYLLRGVEGIYCPECGTVRPAPLEGEDAAAG